MPQGTPAGGSGTARLRHASSASVPHPPTPSHDHQREGPAEHRQAHQNGPPLPPPQLPPQVRKVIPPGGSQVEHHLLTHPQ